MEATLKVTTGPFTFIVALEDVQATTPARGSGVVVLSAPSYGAEVAATTEEAEEIIAQLRQAVLEARG